MNSMYGKTILKPIETETVVKTEQDFNKYVCFNYNCIQSSIKVGDRCQFARGSLFLMIYKGGLVTELLSA